MEINPAKHFIVNDPINLPDTTGFKSANGITVDKSQNQLENTQSIISLPEGGRVTVEVIYSEAAESAKIDLLQRQPEQQTLLEYANRNIGYIWVSEGYPPNTNVEFGIWWYYNSWGTIYQGYEAGAIITQVNANKYQIGFEAAGDDWDYNDLVLDVTIETFLPLVLIEPPIISTGDTTVVSVKKQYYDGRVEDFPVGQLFEFGIVEGCAAGVLISGSDTSNYFNGVKQPVTFLAADSIENEEETVKIGVGLIETLSASIVNNIKVAESEQDKQKAKNELLNKNPETINALLIGGNCFGGEFQSAKIGFGDVVVKKRYEIEILLGETKYYAVKKKTETGELKIEDIPTVYGEEPKFPADADGWEWIKEKSIWSDRPINIETKGQSPIFYDKFYAKVYYTGTTKPEIYDLPDGMIRVIGRYLGKTLDNKAKLFTIKYQNSLTDTLEIQVVKPKKLGEDILNINGPTKVDYVDSTYNNIDSLLINIAGELGIPPQFLMGIVEQESQHGLGYRYEPFSDIRERKKFRSNYPTHRYWINSETDLGNPTIPHHNNISDARGHIDNYPGHTTVWEIYNEKNTGKNKMYSLGVYYWYRDDYWDPYQEYYYKKLKEEGLDTLVAMDSSMVLADTSYVIFLRDSIEGIGMKGTIAQTRIYASYGFMQLLYSSAIETKFGYNYPNNNSDFLPEYIMIPTINIPYASKHLLAKLRDILKKVNYLEEDTWPKGHAFEKSYWEAFRAYNGANDYPNQVFTHIKDNLPKKN